MAVKSILTSLLMVTCLVSCTNKRGAYHALEAQGFTQISVGGYAAFSCGRDDGAANEFTATNSKGVRVSGVVCCGC